MTAPAAPSPIRVLVVDDQELVRSGFCVILDAADGIIVVGEAANGEAAVSAVASTRPDVVLMDIRMPGMDRPPEVNPSPSRLATLTARERDVLLFLARGRSNAEIATALFVSEATVKPTSATCWPSSACGTGSRPSSWPTRRAWSCPGVRRA